MHRIPLPGANTALTMGIISLISTLCCCGPFGAIFSIIGIVNANKAKRIHKENPNGYSGYENATTGKILSYIGLGFAIITFLVIIAYFGMIAAILASGEWDSLK